MALNIRNEETEALAAKLARVTGESKTDAVKIALRERLARVLREKRGRPLVDELDAIALRCAKQRVRDHRPADEILGYDDSGLPQ